MATRELVSRDLRRVALGGEAIDYVLVRRRGRRGVGLKVNENGLTVSAPATLAIARIEAVVRESERWIRGKLSEWSRRQVPPMEWASGTRLHFLGAGIELRIVAGTRNRVERDGGFLHATLRSPDADEARRAVIAWYKREAIAYLKARVDALAASAGLEAPRVLLSSALARWGSCNSRREVRLAWRLVKAPAELVDYVICHELAHLRHMNHSSAFWAEVERQCPGYKALRARLFETDHLYRSF